LILRALTFAGLVVAAALATILALNQNRVEFSERLSAEQVQCAQLALAARFDSPLENKLISRVVVAPDDKALGLLAIAYLPGGIEFTRISIDERCAATQDN
tara:strand:- start:312 stop:614 length:303 start_codon:yes stop_codon:yes gene_type:complete